MKPAIVSAVRPRVVTLAARALSTRSLEAISKYLVDVDSEDSPFEITELVRLVRTAEDESVRAHALHYLLQARTKAADLILRTAQLFEVRDKEPASRSGRVGVKVVIERQGKVERISVYDSEGDRMDLEGQLADDETAEGESVGTRLGIESGGA